jgi:hypothetical protein
MNVEQIEDMFGEPLDALQGRKVSVEAGNTFYTTELVGFTFDTRLQLSACVRDSADTWHLLQVHPSKIKLV